jgi:hypothetical protein
MPMFSPITGHEIPPTLEGVTLRTSPLCVPCDLQMFRLMTTLVSCL